jgi:3',5'-cyclic AMP phosphodiesterase CpdA
MTMREIRIAQLSDLHFGRHVPQVEEALLASLREAAPTLVAVCGDLTQTAREREFQEARAFLDQLPAPALVVPGNHDLPGWRVWSRFARPWRRWRRHIKTDPHGTTTCSADGLIAVGINTARQWGMHPDWSRGRINALQVAGILYALSQAEPDDLRVVVAHHPFLLTTPGKGRGLVGRSALALRHLHQRADLLLGGHIHLAYSDVVDGMVVAQSGTAISNRLKGEPNSYNLIETAGDQLVVQTRRWDGTSFATDITRRYQRNGHDWHALAEPA